jgi:predicted Zn finger-like uncharacterized protein
MILTCPECATGYFVDDGAIGPAGRLVRCKNCGAQWRATADHAPLELHPEPSPTTPPARSEPQAEPLSGKDLPKTYRAHVTNRQQMRRAAVSGIVWAGIGAAFLLVLGGAALLRVDIVRIWPRTAAAYAAVGLPVNPIGLVIEQVRAQQVLQDGHAALAVSGVIRNVEDRNVTAPPLRITLLDAEGHAVGGKLAVPTNADVPRSGVRHFMVTVLDPPTSTANLMVAFDRRASPEEIARARAERSQAHTGEAQREAPGGLRGAHAPDLAAAPAAAAQAAADPAAAHGDAPAIGSATITTDVPVAESAPAASGSTVTEPMTQPSPPRPSAMMRSPIPSRTVTRPRQATNAPAAAHAPTAPAAAAGPAATQAPAAAAADTPRIVGTGSTTVTPMGPPMRPPVRTPLPAPATTEPHGG